MLLIRKFSSVSIVVLSIFFSCSSSDAPKSAANSCTSILSSGITLYKSYAYTGDDFHLNGNKFCANDLVSVLLNSTEVPFSSIQSNQVFFKIPGGLKDSVSVQIKSKDGIVDLKLKLMVFPGGGTWSKVTNFPGSPRAGSVFGVYGESVFIASGAAYLGYDSVNKYKYNYFNDMFEYNLTSNSWNNAAVNDSLKMRSIGMMLGAKFFLWPSTITGPVTIYDTNTGHFPKATGNYASFGISPFPFTIGNDLYESDPDGNTKTLDIKKYDAASNSWVLVANMDYSSLGSSIYIDFAVTDPDNSIAYIGWQDINSTNVETWMFNPVDNSFIRITTGQFTPASKNFPVLKYLFKGNGLAYFVESGGAEIYYDQYVKILQPASMLYIFNLKTREWHMSSHTYPEPMYAASGFFIGNRLFGGMGATANGALFNYSTNIYEFTPN